MLNVFTVAIGLAFAVLCSIFGATHMEENDAVDVATRTTIVIATTLSSLLVGIPMAILKSIGTYLAITLIGSMSQVEFLTKRWDSGGEIQPSSEGTEKTETTNTRNCAATHLDRMKMDAIELEVQQPKSEEPAIIPAQTSPSPAPPAYALDTSTSSLPQATAPPTVDSTATSIPASVSACIKPTTQHAQGHAYGPGNAEGNIGSIQAAQQPCVYVQALQEFKAVDPANQISFSKLDIIQVHPGENETWMRGSVVVLGKHPASEQAPTPRIGFFPKACVQRVNWTPQQIF